MKSFLFFFAGLFLCVPAFAQSSGNYHVYANRIKQFSKPARILHNTINAEGNGFIEFTNTKNQILRFRLQNNKLQKGSCSIAFEIYYYEKNYLKKIESLDSNGNLIGCNLKLNGEAVTEYIIEKPALYLKKKKLIDDAEGNIDMKDDSSEKIIRVQYFDINNRPILQLQPYYISSKTYWDSNIRMAWP
ncbi:hypothetical protein L1276_001325 [Flavobacterium sp. HSC-32F16]|uniref:hypothetical protein n=1 Tax=Flavobacterium sp. HSC-32F16 TaxID=2910964 RepID=UPI0020A5B514|nr:hypothetical protein [Flavobacterium sp. HSC-32F16]MCP2026185.1 hypothetical protein [Flavobacterium sp. HSC-32F16]